MSLIKEELVKHGSRSLIDLGSGNGKILFSIASNIIYTTGYENSLFLYLFSKMSKMVRKNGRYIDIKFGSLFNADLHNHDTIYIYGIPGMMQRTQTKIMKEAKEGTLVISNTFDFPNLEKLYERGNLNFYLV
ncbi:MAG: hypothetical protein WC243_03765 [Patescibacteria group bacterium]|jgi:hypothetical protein